MEHECRYGRTFLDLGSRWKWVVSFTLCRLSHWENPRVNTGQETVWVPVGSTACTHTRQRFRKGNCQEVDVSSYTIRGSTVVKSLCYKPEGRGFETRWGELFPIYLILPSAPGPGVHSACNRNDNQKQKKKTLDDWNLCSQKKALCVSTLKYQGGIVKQLSLGTFSRHSVPT
jgi:hypothetical protein